MEIDSISDKCEGYESRNVIGTDSTASSVTTGSPMETASRRMSNPKQVARSRMSKRDYDLVVEYLEDPDHFQQINSNGKTKVGGKNLTKKTAFGHMAVHLAALGFPPCGGGTVMQKKFDRYYDSYKRAGTFYVGTGAGITEEESRSGKTLEKIMNANCPLFFRMHALFGTRANVDPPAVGDFGLADEGVYIPDPILDSQFPESSDLHHSGNFEECRGVDLNDDLNIEDAAEMDDVELIPSQTVASHLRTSNESGTSHVEVGVTQVEIGAEAPSNEVLRSKRKFVQENGNVSCASQRSRVEKLKIPERKQNLVSVYEDSIQEKNSYRQAALHARDEFRHALLADKRKAREEIDKRAKVDRRAQLIAEMSKARKSIEDIRAAFELLDSVEMSVSIV